MEEKVFFEGKLGKICGILNRVSEEKRIVIIVHGYSSHKNTSAKINAENLAEIGVNTLRIDLDNMGESDLDFVQFGDVTHYISQVESSIEFARSIGFEIIDLIGTSYGGFVVLIVAKENRNVRKVFLRAPMFDWKEDFRRKYGEDKFLEWEKKGFRQYIKRDGRILMIPFSAMEDTLQYNMNLYAPRIKNKIQIIQGNKDMDCFLETTQKIVPLFPKVNMQIINGAGHNLGVNGDFSEGIRVMVEFLRI